MKERGSVPWVAFGSWRSGSRLCICCLPTGLIGSAGSRYSHRACAEPFLDVWPSPHLALQVGWRRLVTSPGRLSLPLHGCSPLSTCGRERCSLAVGCCAQLLIDVKGPSNSYFLFNTSCRRGTELGFMISILQMMKLILRNVSKWLSWGTIPWSPDSDVHAFPTSFLDTLLFKGLWFLISLSDRDILHTFESWQTSSEWLLPVRAHQTQWVGL